jgi:hypothetical protein
MEISIDGQSKSPSHLWFDHGNLKDERMKRWCNNLTVVV